MGDILVGLDVGSVSVSVAEVGPDGVLLRGATVRHRGDPVGVARQLLARLGGPGPEAVAATESTPAALPAAHRADNLVATIRAARVLHPGLGALLLVGGEKFSLSVFEPGGRYKGSRFNSLCAAGTGSFLDQQAQRLGLADSSELAGLARRAEGARPRIATRCAVFAKTDLIHAQQEGYDLPAICDGLCQGLAANVHDALFSGQPPPEPVVFAGGVARNQAVTRHLQALLGCPLVVDEHCSLYGALGAALELGRVRRGEPAELPPPAAPGPAGVKGFYAPLALVRSEYPTRWSERSYAFSPRVVPAPGPVEVDEYQAPTRGARVPVLLGIDVGSTSTKAVLLDPAGPAGPGDEGLPVLAGFYTRTAGQPLVAA
ncbi:MAG TPA: BadF/BadG/BcrA/BcrD ATPase family protein, partial [Myxococcota bacterium]|nr:BadF/BadG/BcrA/BcrD ATPase family protein [Myxococcota bacterium]